MASGPYDIGDKVRVTATFKDVADALVDPTNVVLKFKDPSAVVTTPTVTRTSLGIYYAEQSITAAGVWYYRAEATGTGQSAAEGTFTVITSNFP